MILPQKIKNFVAKFQTSEFDRLRYRYISVPRYTHCQINFRSLTFETWDAASVIWQIKETFFDEHLKFQSNSSSPTIIDCGSNVGVTVMYFKKLFPTANITAFEADLKTFDILKINLETNKIEGVLVLAKAVWKDTAGVQFSPDGADGGSIYGIEPRVPTPSIRLKDILIEKNTIDMLKMDIEGAETEVLLDCGETLRKVHYLFVEYHSFSSHSQDLDKILKLLSENNFRYYLGNDDRKKDHFMRTGPANNATDLQVNIYATNQLFGKK